VIKRTQKESDQEANTNSGRNLSKQKKTNKDRFFGRPFVAQIEK
jgi:hypothetical protein